MTTLFAAIFLLVCAVVVFAGMFTLLSNTRSQVNIAFACLCACMALWAFGFSIAVNAATLQTCLLGRRIAAAGWSVLFSVAVHFGLLFTGRKDILKKPLAYFLLYAPAAACLYVFSLSDTMAGIQYNMVITPTGWTNVAVNNGWDLFFYAYYISFSLLSCYLLWHWGSQSQSASVKRQAWLLMLAWISTVAVGSFDLFYNTLFPGRYLPQMAPLSFLIPILVGSHCIRRYGFMQMGGKCDSDFILTSSIQPATYNYLSFALYAGAFLYFFSQYTMKAVPVLAAVLPFGLFLFLTGVLIQAATRMKVQDNILELIYIVAVFTIIPVITLRFLAYGGITIWAFPFITLIFAMLFRRKAVLICTTVSIFLTQALIWLLRPRVQVVIDNSDYSARIGLFMIAVWVALYVHRAFVLRLRENEEQIADQRLISDISGEMVSIDASNQAQKLQAFLSLAGRHFHADRARLLMCGLTIMEQSSFYWLGDEGRSGFLEETNLLHEDAGDPLAVLVVNDSGELQGDGRDFRGKLIREGIRSMVSIPILIGGQAAAYFRLELTGRKKEWRDGQIELLHIISRIIADAIEKVRAEDKVHFLAYYDNLTKMPNRLLFEDRAVQALSLAQRTEKTAGVIFLDLDGFKSINDTMGHQSGDALIREVSGKLLKTIRKTDTVARFGGDEFVMMINHLQDPGDINKVMEAIMGLFTHPFFVNGQEMFVTASAGVAMYPIDGRDTETLIKSADIAMLHAKDRGKNQYVLCSPDMREEIRLKMRLTNNLYRALERKELEVYYQPQLDIQSGQVVGLEALLRWQHPDLGMVEPSLFIPLMEQTGLINAIGEWVLQTACAQNKAWQQMGLPKIRVAVNVSVNQFRNPNLVRRVADILTKTHMDPHDLELEITESAAIRESSYIISVLGELKKLNVCISIDDFGTEYSSLSRLKLLPVDRIKVDMQFVREIEHSDRDRAISEVIINLAKSLGMKVIAEGVETQGQLDILCLKSCDEAQGYYFCKPLPASGVEAYLRGQAEHHQA